jgi:hypothetical protein
MEQVFLEFLSMCCVELLVGDDDKNQIDFKFSFFLFEINFSAVLVFGNQDFTLAMCALYHLSHISSPFT